MHPLDAALRLEAVGDDAVRGRTSADWANMVGPFGGITAAVLLRAVEQHPKRQGEPLTLTVNYLAPIADGGFDISLRIVRTNRTNQHWLVELAQGGEVKTTASAVFAVRRDAWSDTETERPVAAEPGDVASGDMRDVVVWTKNYDMRFVAGGMPAADAGPAPSSRTTLWIRDNPLRAIDFTALTALCDVFYPRVFLRRGHFVPAGTISMTVYFHADGEQLATQGDDFVLASAVANRFSRGYFDQSAQLWGRGGALLASTHQIVYYKS